jgi:hypothetical protein
MLSLTDRDISLILTIYEYDGCGVTHLYRKFWHQSKDTDDPGNACYRRIQQLVTHGWLQATRLPSLTGLGGGRHFLTLSSKGRQLVADHQGLSRSTLRRLREIETPFAAAHHWACCDFRLALELACERNSQASLDEWVSERELRGRPIVKVPDPRPSDPAISRPLIPLISDGEFRLSFPGGLTAAYRVEIDLGTISRKRIAARLRAQLVHAKRDERPVLWVVPNPARQQAISTWAIDEASVLSADPTIFWLTQRARVNHTTVLTPIWDVVAGPRLALVPEAVLISKSSNLNGTIRFSSDGGDNSWKP